METSTLFMKYIHIATVIIAYWIVSISTVFVNKALFSSENINLDAPVFVTWYQCVLSAGICWTLSVLAKIYPNAVSFPPGSPLTKSAIREVAPLAVLFSCMIVFNNLCLKYVDVAFYYIGRSLTTVFNVILSYMLLGQKTSFSVIICCCMIVCGFWIGIDQESLTGSLSVIGVVFGILGSITLPLYSIHTKKVLPAINQEIWLLSYYNNVYSAVLLIPFIILNKELSNVINYEKLFDPYFWFLMNIGGICGFAIGFLSGLQIKVTSPLTHNISGTAKACFQTVIASHWYGEYKPTMWWVSNWVVLIGSMAYTYVRHYEMKKKDPYPDLPLGYGILVPFSALQAFTPKIKFDLCILYYPTELKY